MLINKNKNLFKNGFTLIELLVVIAIIGLLAIIVLFNISSIRARSRDARRVADIKSLQEALIMYEDNNGQYPVYADLPITGSDALSNDLTSEDLMSAVPTDPINAVQGSNDYRYIYDSGGATYTITFYLETDSIVGRSAGENSISP